MVAMAVAGGSLVACAALTGLDQITEDACAPDGCEDAHGDAVADGGARNDTGASTPDASVDVNAGSDADAGHVDDAADAIAPDAAASLEAGTDAADAADAATSDGPADAQPASDSPPDAPCGTVYLAETFDSADGGWKLDSTWSIAPTCPSPPAPQKGYPDPTVDHTTASAGGVAGVYACGNNPAGTTSAFRYATSPPVDVSTAPSLKLGFYRWLNSDAEGWMTSTVDVFDGSAWVNVYSNPSGAGNLVADSAWTKVEYDVTAHRNAAFRVRFGYAVPEAGVYAMSCWNVDDVTVSTLSCP
jgi:hypothetical protein